MVNSMRVVQFCDLFKFLLLFMTALIQSGHKLSKNLKKVDFRQEVCILAHTSYLLGDGSPPSRGRVEMIMI